MNKKVLFLSLTTLLATLVTAPGVSAGNTAQRTWPLLRAVNTVYVQIQKFDPDLRKEMKKAGLDEDVLQISVERRLEQAGMKAQSEQEYGTSIDKTVLLIKIEVLSPDAMQKVFHTVDGETVPKSGPPEKFIYRTDVGLRQQVSLASAPNIQGTAVTWSTGALGFRRLSRIQPHVMEQVDAFITAVKTANNKSID